MDTKNYRSKVYVVRPEAYMKHFSAFPVPRSGTAWRIVDFDIGVIALKPYRKNWRELHAAGMDDPVALAYFLLMDEAFYEFSEEMYNLLYEKD